MSEEDVAGFTWLDKLPEEDAEVFSTIQRSGRCDYCKSKAVETRVLQFPNMPSLAHDGKSTTPFHFMMLVEHCAECYNRFGKRANAPVPFTLVELLVELVKEWHVSNFPDSDDRPQD